ncbi:hypothetical protein JM16_000473 [Phytophthora kernoviae]|uniref:mitogen-activated protein kinase kinase n=1 Tax=Phytophthora kernoviae TaxID=325452 RepID=A0A8T0M8U7_9STRA|nr:hypothetical protein JM16_000473 [Phytophthora kernoviae]
MSSQRPGDLFGSSIRDRLMMQEVLQILATEDASASRVPTSGSSVVSGSSNNNNNNNNNNTDRDSSVADPNHSDNGNEMMGSTQDEYEEKYSPEQGAALLQQARDDAELGHPQQMQHPIYPAAPQPRHLTGDPHMLESASEEIRRRKLHVQELQAELVGLQDLEAELTQYQQRSVESLQEDLDARTQEVNELLVQVEAAAKEELDWGTEIRAQDDKGSTLLLGSVLKGKLDNGKLLDYSFHEREDGYSLVWRKLLDAVLGLHFLHERHIVHSDLKCNQILVSKDGVGMLTDFSLSFLTTVTSEEKTVGAIRWKAPERIRKDNSVAPSVQSDVYSFGICGDERGALGFVA